MKTIFKITTLLFAFILAISIKVNAQSTGATNVYNAANYLGWGATSGDLLFKVNNNTKMVLKNTSGNFGIGTTTPNNLLEVSGGDIDVETSTKGYMIDDAYVLKHGGDVTNIFVGWASGASISTGANNTFTGAATGFVNSSGDDNTFIGYRAGIANTTADDNTFIGYNSGQANSTGYRNSFGGSRSGEANTTGYSNTFFGNDCGSDNTTGYSNSAYGDSAFAKNTTGWQNTAIGYRALKVNNGDANVAVGRESLVANTSGDQNVAIGNSAMFTNTSGIENTAVGSLALGLNTSGCGNTALGELALWSNTSANENVAVGVASLYSNTTGTHNTAVGFTAMQYGATYSNSGSFGYNSSVTASNQIQIGNGSVTSIGGSANWTNFSDARFKKDIVENVPGLEFVNKLRPVTYHLDMDGIAALRKTPDSLRLKDAEVLAGKLLHTGFLAQEVEKAANDLNYDFSGVDKPINPEGYYGLRYAEFVVPLVKAVQELSATVDSLKNELASTSTPQLEGQEETATSISINSAARDLPVLAQNQPNPFNESTLLRFYLPKGTKGASIKVYDINGAVYRLFELAGEGPGTVKIEGNTLDSGNYFYSLIIDGSVVDTKTMAITK